MQQSAQLKRITGPIYCYAVMYITILAAFVNIAATKSKTALTTKDFFRGKEVYNFNLSRDGKKVSYVMHKEGKTFIMIYDLDSGEYSSIQVEGDPDDYISFLEWANGERFVFKKNHRSLYGIDATGQNAKLLVKYEKLYSETLVLGERRGLSKITEGDLAKSTIRPYWIQIPVVLDMLENDPDHILVEVRDETFTSNIYEVDIYTGKDRLVFDDLHGATRWITDQNGELRAGLEYRNRSAKLRYRDPDSKKWKAVDNFLKEESGMSFEFDAEVLTKRHCELLDFGYDPNILYFGSNLKNDTMGVYAYDLEKQEIVATIAEHPEYDLVDTAEYNHDLLRFSKSKQSLVGLDTYFHEAKTEWTDPDFKAVQATVDKLLPQKQNYIQEWNDDETVFLIFSRTSNDPGSYYVLDLSSKKFLEVAKTRPWLDPTMMSEKFSFTIESRDGYPLSGYLTVPQSAAGKSLPMNLPMVVYPHGGPWTRDYRNFENAVQFLAYNGYAVLQVNYRGSTGYGYKHFDRARQNIGTGILNDITDAVDWAVDNGIADAKRIAIMGEHFGGYTALMGLTHDPKRYCCGISIAGIADLKNHMMNYVEGRSKRYFAYDYWRSIAGDPKKDSDYLEAISPINHLENLEDPVLVIHETDDRNVSINQSKLLVRALEKADKPHSYKTIFIKEYENWDDEIETEKYNYVLEFLNSYMK